MTLLEKTEKELVEKFEELVNSGDGRGIPFSDTHFITLLLEMRERIARGKITIDVNRPAHDRTKAAKESRQQFDSCCFPWRACLHSNSVNPVMKRTEIANGAIAHGLTGPTRAVVPFLFASAPRGKGC